MNDKPKMKLKQNITDKMNLIKIIKKKKTYLYISCYPNNNLEDMCTCKNLQC